MAMNKPKKDYPNTWRPKSASSEGPKKRTPVKKTATKLSDVYKPDNKMMKLPANFTPSQIANIKAYAKSLETRRKGAAADKMGAEGPKRSTPVKKAAKKK